MRLLRFALNDEFYGILKFSKPCVIPQLDWGISIGNSRIPLLCHCEGAKRPKQSLGILNSSGVLGA